MLELADKQDLESCARKGVEVRSLSWAHLTMGDEKSKPHIVLTHADLEKPQPENERIVLTAADLNPRAAKYPVEILQQKPPQHPFEREPLNSILKSMYDISSENIASVTKPRISNHPDDLELWESQQIVGRRERYPLEPDDGYLVRMLYEEAFSVNQNPSLSSVLHKSSAGLTPGGLLSHFASFGPSNELRQVLDTQPSGATLQEAYQLWTTDPETGKDYDDPTKIAIANSKFIQLADAVIQITKSQDKLGSIVFNRLTGYHVLQRLKEGVLPPEDLNTIGFRVFKMLLVAPEFLSPVSDRDFLKKLGVTHTNPIAVMQAHAMVWRKCKPLFDFVGSGREMREQEITALALLLSMRFHPEFQVFYRYFSPSGYLNENNEIKKVAIIQPKE